ncbi:MAG: gas vesicle protein GvpD basic region 2 domain-containing protein, partial [Methanosarcinales archaeon]
DSKTHFSTGNKDLNEMLEGGYPRGSYVFIEVGKDVDYAAYFLIPMLAVANFVTLGRGVSIIPVSGKNPENIKYEASRYGIENEVNNLIKVSDNSLKKDFQNWNEVVLNLKEKTGESVLRLIGYDTMESLLGRSALSEIISLEAQSISDNKDLGIAIGKDSTPETNKILADIAEIHLKIEKRNRVLIIYGKKPETGIYAVTPDISNGYPDIKLTPIV